MSSVLTTGCSASGSSDSAVSPAAGPVESAPTAVETSTLQIPQQGQELPITADVQVGAQQIQLEVAKTPEQLATGLMYRTTLADDRGMLFVFKPARPVSFWMKNVPMNLDMVFLQAGTVVKIAEQVPPCTTEPCPVYGPAGIVVDQVIELRGGRAAELGLQSGDRLEIKYRK